MKKKLRALISMIVVLAICLQMTVSAANVTQFEDVSPEHWAYESIAYAISFGIMGGTDEGKFEPDAVASRAMMVASLYRLAGEPTVDNADVQAFPDVALGAWYTIPIRWAANIGVVYGRDDGTFGPNDNILREQIALIMWRYADYLDYDTSTAGAETGVFPDFKNTPIGYQTAVKWAIKKQMLVGRDGYLAPNEAATRAEVAACLHRFVTNNRPVTSISLQATSKEVNIGWSGYLSVTVHPEGCARDERVYWTSDNPDVATVDFESGRITTKSIGTTVIRAKARDGGYTARCVLSVVPIEYTTHRIGKFVTAESADALADYENSDSVYNSLPWKVEYEGYYTGAMITATGGAYLNMPDAARLFMCFLQNGGDSQTIDFARMNLENRKANANMVEEVNKAIDAAEYFLSYYDSSITFTTIAESNYDASYESTALNLTNNWYQAIHGYRTWYSCEVSKTGDAYTMIMEYYLRDFYDWDPQNTQDAPIVSQAQMYTLHCAGMAKHFKVTGQMKMSITWTAGQRLGNGASYQII